MRLVFGVGLCFFAAGAWAGAFDEIQIDGQCRSQNTHVIENGDSLSILFDDLGIEMPEGEQGDGKHFQQSCRFRVRISFPRDRYLSGLRQVFSGGVIKSKGSMGSLMLINMLQSTHGFPGIHWKQGVAIGPESEASLFTKVLVDRLPEPSGCSGNFRYGMQVRMSATRKDLKEFFIGGLDSYDAELIQRLDLVPEWKPCRPRQNPGRGNPHAAFRPGNS